MPAKLANNVSKEALQAKQWGLSPNAVESWTGDIPVRDKARFITLWRIICHCNKQSPPFARTFTCLCGKSYQVT